MRRAVATIDASGNLLSLTAGTTGLTATSTADSTKSDTVTLIVNPLGVLAWTRQFGTGSDDVANAVATDTNGNVYAAGTTGGVLEGGNAGSTDIFIRKHGR